MPVLLGAGVMLSALAYVVERIAEATALPMLDRHLSRRLSILAPPAGGLLGTEPASARPERPEPRLILATVVGTASIVLIGWLGVQALGDATQSRPDPAALVGPEGGPGAG